MFSQDIGYEKFNYMLDRLNKNLFRVVLEKSAAKNYTVQFLFDKFSSENSKASNFVSFMTTKLKNCESMLSQFGS